MKRKTPEASTIKPAEAGGSMRFDVNCSLEESEKYYRNAGLHDCFRSAGITDTLYGELDPTEEHIIKIDPLTINTSNAKGSVYGIPITRGIAPQLRPRTRNIKT